MKHVLPWEKKVYQWATHWFSTTTLNQKIVHEVETHWLSGHHYQSRRLYWHFSRAWNDPSLDLLEKVETINGWPWCNGYRCWKWTSKHEFKSWTTLNAFHITLTTLGKVWIQLFSLQLWVNSRADWVLQPWWGNYSRRRKTLNSNLLNSA